MQDGGLQDEGGTVDKESGNDVPSGSLKKEVRDDVPAMLSEGEFVIPADVVRYIGLEKLMQMRQQAKMGLQMMEKMGQMGNSEEAEIPDDLPFGVTDIVVMGSDDDDDEKEMAQGGVIYAQEGTDVSSSRSIPNWVNPPSGDGPVTMAQVKLTNPVTGETFTANTGGYSVKSVDEIKRMMGEENTDVSKGVGAVLLPDGTIDNSAMMDMYNRGQQPQQTDFERMMGYGAGQGANPYMARRVPYTKKDGSTVNILEDYMGRPMESIEGLTRVDPYQAGPVIGGDTPAGGGIVSPVMPPMPVDPTEGTTPKRKDRDAFYGKGADSTGRLTSMAEARKQGKKLGDFSDAYDAHQARLNDPTRTGNLLEDLKTAREDLKTRPSLMKEDLINQLKAIPDEFKKAPDVLKAIGDVYKGAGKEVINKITGKDDNDAEKKAREKRRKEKRKEDREKKASSARKNLTIKERSGGAKLDKEYGISGLKNGGLMKKDYP